MSAIDLNLLRVFDALLEEGSATRAGSRLGLTQSAVSHALTRLRHHFDDPLFIRGPSGMTPTARALEIGPGVHTALAQLQNALNPTRFDPAGANRRFTLTTGSYG
ncbi:MAG: LysR family transcriptional regulator, partial [Brevundimonas sp.]